MIATWDADTTLLYHLTITRITQNVDICNNELVNLAKTWQVRRYWVPVANTKDLCFKTNI